MAFVCTSVILLTSVVLASAPIQRITINTATNTLVDQDGRTRFFHGINTVYKGPPYIPIIDSFDPQRSLSQHDFELLRSWGLNLIRLGVMWPGVEPDRGYYNNSYVDRISDIIQTAASYGIFTIVDFHQDVLSQKYCGEGAPSWAVDTPSNFPRPLQWKSFKLNDDGQPSSKDCQKHDWGNYYFTFAAAEAFQSLYDNVDGRADALAGYWGHLAEKFKGLDSIIGMQLFNEPFAGDIFRHPFLLIPGLATRYNILPLYDRLAKAIYDADPNRNVIFQPVTWAESGVGPSWFHHVPGGNQHRNTSILAFHYYNPPNIGDVHRYIKDKVALAESMGVPTIMTETWLNKDLPAVADLLDFHLVSYACWEYKTFGGLDPDGVCTGCIPGPFSSNGTVNDDLVKIVSRPYAQAVAGKTLVNQFFSSNSTFVLEFEPDPAILAPTILYVPFSRHYQNGYDIHLTPSEARYDILHDTIEIRPTNASPTFSTVRFEIYSH